MSVTDLSTAAARDAEAILGRLAQARAAVETIIIGQPEVVERTLVTRL